MHEHSHHFTLGLSFFLGALHALEPGHGKTAMLIYLSKGKRSRWHPVVMGVSSAMAHSVSLMAIAFAVHLAHHLTTGDHHHEHGVSSALQWISATLVLGVGAWMLYQAWRGKEGSCCHHEHSGEVCEHSTHQLVQLGGPETQTDGILKNAHSHDERYQVTALLGIAVGLLPCPSALAAYFTGLSSGSPAQAYLIVGLFAAGIAVSLSAVGLVLQKFGDRLEQRMHNMRHLPWSFVRASLILAVGAFYTLRLTFFGSA